MNTDSISQRLAEIKKVVPYQKLLDRHTDDTSSIAAYYKTNRLAYRLINSWHGFVHMGISKDGVLRKEDFLEPARLVSEYIDRTTASQVLELAAGKAANAKFLANRHTQVAFVGLDLPDGQLDIRASRPANLKLVEGNYTDLSRFEDASFDLVYIIEALCHAPQKEKVTKEVQRILKTGGVFIIFDGYASKSQDSMNAEEALASDLIYTSMMVTKRDHTYGTLRQNLRDSDFVIINEDNLSSNVLPTMHRFEKLAAFYFRHPVFAKILNTIIPLEITGNAVAGYLMPLSVKQGLHQYWLTIAQKK